MKLIEKTEKHLPIPVRPSCSLVRMLRRQGIYVDAYKPLEIHSALYMENEAGIACDITPRGWENTPVICSLAQLGVTGNDVLAGLSTGVNKEPRALPRQRSCRLYHHA